MRSLARAVRLPRLKWVWLVLVPILWLSWYLVPSSYSSDHVHFTVHHGGTPMAVTFIVRDPSGKPLPDVRVYSENFSGDSGSITDANGVAIISEGEPEVLSVSIRDDEFRLCPRVMILDDLFSPDCSKGLTLQITITP